MFAYPIAQATILFLINIPMVLYMIFKSPFKGLLDKVLHTFTECAFLVVNLSVLIIAGLETKDESSRDAFGGIVLIAVPTVFLFCFVLCVIKFFKHIATSFSKPNPQISEPVEQAKLQAKPQESANQIKRESKIEVTGNNTPRESSPIINYKDDPIPLGSVIQEPSIQSSSLIKLNESPPLIPAESPEISSSPSPKKPQKGRLTRANTKRASALTLDKEKPDPPLEEFKLENTEQPQNEPEEKALVPPPSNSKLDESKVVNSSVSQKQDEKLLNKSETKIEETIKAEDLDFKDSPQAGGKTVKRKLTRLKSKVPQNI